MDDDGRFPWSRIDGPDPPEEAYSRVSDPERYLSLHAVADDLVTALVAEGTVEAGAVEVEGRWRGGVLRAVELRPLAGGGTPVTVITTGFGVVVRGGTARERGFPVCGCDACDESPGYLADELGTVLRALVGGPDR
ncbi:MAG TPA: DUF6226 family protein [Iamia sp.]